MLEERLHGMQKVGGSILPRVLPDDLVEILSGMFVRCLVAVRPVTLTERYQNALVTTRKEPDFKC